MYVYTIVNSLLVIIYRTQRILKAGSAKSSGAAKVVQILQTDVDKAEKGYVAGLYSCMQLFIGI